ncbi:hypothetical protein [Winogradskyella poriferorum]|uniref:hypothetical protein n=1 Tax=Winogradskyella poriferorum TaxID=307627 RepID=UPI003D64C7B7
MARDYTKYNVEGLGENLNKRKLVFTIVKDWVEKNNPSFEELQTTFPDKIHGGNPDKFGLVRKEVDVKNHKYFNMREPLKIKQGVHVVVMNQWGENIENFIAASEKLGYKIRKKENTVNKESIENNDFEITLDENFPTSFVNQLTDNRKDENFLNQVNNFFEKELRTDHKYFGAAKLFESLTNSYYDNEADEFEAYYMYTNYKYEAAFKIEEDEWELKDVLKETPLADKILELEDLNISDVGSIDFKLYYCAYFKYVVEQLAYCEDPEILAEFINAQALGYSDQIVEGFNYEEDWLVDFVDKLLFYFYEIDVDDYEGEYTANGLYFGVNVESEIDYVKIAQEIIDSVI